jgi:hypothetical protein
MLVADGHDLSTPPAGEQAVGHLVRREAIGRASASLRSSGPKLHTPIARSFPCCTSFSIARSVSANGTCRRAQ